MLRFLTVLALIFCSANVLAANQTRYISDNLYLYLLSGPGTQYRILGSIEAGQRITLLPDTQGEFSKIIDPKGREGWVKTKLLAKDESLRFKYPKLEAELKQTKAQRDQALVQNDDNAKALAQVNAELSELKTRLERSQAQRDQALEELAHIKKNEQAELWKQGAMIAAGGLLLGIILVYLPRPRRKQKNRW